MTMPTQPPSTRPTSPLICSLRSDQDAPLSLVGGKGANLVRLIQARFPVPDGFVITTAAYRAFVTSAGIGQAGADPDQLQARLIAAPIPMNLSVEIV